MDDCSSDGESVATNTTVGSTGCSPRQMFKGLNMLEFNTQEMEKLTEERCYSPIIPSQIVTALSQLTEPLFSDNESSCSQSLLIADIAKHVDRDDLIRGGSNNVNHLTCEDIQQSLCDNNRSEDILSGQCHLPVFHDKPGLMGIGKSYPSVIEAEKSQKATAFNPEVDNEDLSTQSQLLLPFDKPDLVGIGKLPSSIKGVAESESDSDATRLETDVEVSPTPNSKSFTQDTTHLELQVKHFFTGTNSTGDEANNALDDDTDNVSFSQISMLFPSLDSGFTQAVKDETQLHTQDNLSRELAEQNTSTNSTAIFRKIALTREASVTKSSFIPPFKKVCRPVNQIHDSKTNYTYIEKSVGQCTLKQNRGLSNSSSTVDTNKNFLSNSYYFTNVHSSSCQPVDSGLGKVSQAVTSTANDVEQSQVSTVSSRSLFSSSVPSESQASKPSDCTTDPVKQKPSEGHVEHGDMDEQMQSSMSGATVKDKNVTISHNSVEKGCENSVSDLEISQISHDHTNDNAKSVNVSEQMSKQYIDSTSSIDNSYIAVRSDNEVAKNVMGTESRGLPFFTKQLAGPEDKTESLSKPINSQSSSSDQASHYMKSSTESPSGLNRNNNWKSSPVDKTYNSNSSTKRKTLHTPASSSYGSSITKSPQSERSLGKKSNQRKSTKSEETITSEAKCKSNFITACKTLQHEGMDRDAIVAESKVNAVEKARNEPEKLSVVTSETSVDLPDRSEKTQLIKMAAQYTEIGELLDTRHLDKNTLESLTQRVKGLQMKILKLSECHKQERANMTAKIQSGVLSKSEKLQLKSDMQCLAERQKLLVEIVKKHKDANTKLKSISVLALSGSSVSVSQDKSTNVSSGQVLSASQTSKSSIFDNKAPSAENILGDGNKRSDGTGITAGKNMSSTDKQSLKIHKQIACDEPMTASKTMTTLLQSEGVTQENSSTSSGSPTLFSNAKKSPILIKQIIDLTNNSEGSTFVKFPQMPVSASIHDTNKSITCTSSTLNKNKETTVDNQRYQSKIAATISLKELPCKTSLNENGQKLLDDIFFTHRNEPHRYAKTEVKVNSTDSVATSGTEVNTRHQLMTGSIIKANHVTVNTDTSGKHIETQIHTSNEIIGMTQGKPLNVNANCNIKPSVTQMYKGKEPISLNHGQKVNSDVDCKDTPSELQVHAGNNSASIISGNHVNTKAVSNDEGCVAFDQQTCDNHSAQISNKSEAVEKTPKPVIIIDAQKQDHTYKRQIQDHATASSSIQLKRSKVLDKNGNILDVFIIQNPQNLNTPNSNTAMKIQIHADASSSLDDIAKVKQSDIVSHEVLNTGEIAGAFTKNTQSEVMLKTSVDLSCSKPGSNGLEQNTNRILSYDEQNQCSKHNAQSNYSPSQVISPVCQNPPVFKSPQIIPTTEASTTTSPCSTAVSSDVFPVSCTELARRMKAKAIKQLQSSCQTQNSKSMKIIKMTPVEKLSVPAEQGHLTAKSPCLKDLVTAGLVKPGRHVLSVSTKNGKVWADVTNGGLIRGREGKIFRTPCAWMSAITDCVAKKKALVYQQIHYLNKPLSEYIRELTLTNKTEVELKSSVTRSSPCSNHRSVSVQQSRPVQMCPVKDKLSHPDSPSQCSDPVLAGLLQTLHRCTVKLIDDAEIVHCPDLTPTFWSSDFNKVKMSKHMWASVDCWS